MSFKMRCSTSADANLKAGQKQGLCHNSVIPAVMNGSPLLPYMGVALRSAVTALVSLTHVHCLRIVKFPADVQQHVQVLSAASLFPQEKSADLVGQLMYVYPDTRTLLQSRK